MDNGKKNIPVMAYQQPVTGTVTTVPSGGGLGASLKTYVSGNWEEVIMIVVVMSAGVILMFNGGYTLMQVDELEKSGAPKPAHHDERKRNALILVALGCMILITIPAWLGIRFWRHRKPTGALSATPLLPTAQLSATPSNLTGVVPEKTLTSSSV